MKIRLADQLELVTEQGSALFQDQDTARFHDALAVQSLCKDRLTVTLRADQTPVRMIRLRWYFTDDESFREPVRVLGDAWERGYGDLEWRGIVPERYMPWVCAVSNGTDSALDCSNRFTRCFGVKSQPGAFCMWQVDQQGVTLIADVRNGGSGVCLRGREITVCEVLLQEYAGISAFQALKRFYRLLCDHPLPLSQPVYGANNWYYAYGRSSDKDILQDSALVSRLCGNNENPPYMVIDDGWQKNATDGPWDRGNDRFPDMAGLCERMKALKVKPGLWVRYLSDAHRDTGRVTGDMRLMRDGNILDPSHPAVLEKIQADTRRLTREWGYQLIKHDFSTYDIFGFWGFQRPGFLAEDGWRFYDPGKTSAEIILQFYRAIYESIEPDTVLLGCNVIGHLAAGWVHLNRTGDDTSGVEWERTRKMGVNTLAFRMAQHQAFFQADADCVGITGKIDWRMNGQWLRILSQSGTPLFVSCLPSQAQGEVEQALLSAFERASVQNDTFLPLDWMETTCPERWLLNGEEIHFQWNE